MDKCYFFNILILLFLFIGNFLINTNHYFLLIYLFLLLYHNYIFYLILINKYKKKIKIFKFILLSILLYLLTYFIICDPNPVFCFFSYYIFFPNFFKAILIILVHTYFLSRYLYVKTYNHFNYTELSFDKNNLKKRIEVPRLFFLCDFLNLYPLNFY